MHFTLTLCLQVFAVALTVGHAYYSSQAEEGRALLRSLWASAGLACRLDMDTRRHRDIEHWPDE